MREELSGNFLELALALLREPLAFHIDLVNVLLKVHIAYYCIECMYILGFG